MRDLVLRFTENPDWLPSVSRDITDAIHAELPEARPLVYFLTLTDQRKAAVSTEHDQLDR